jgi:hypothetical protein
VSSGGEIELLDGRVVIERPVDSTLVDFGAVDDRVMNDRVAFLEEVERDDFTGLVLLFEVEPLVSTTEDRVTFETFEEGTTELGEEIAEAVLRCTLDELASMAAPVLLARTRKGDSILEGVSKVPVPEDVSAATRRA